MEFLLWTFVGLAALALASFIIVEGGSAINRIYARLLYWSRYHYLSWSSARQIRALKRRFGRERAKSPSFRTAKGGYLRSMGQLRVTKSRADSLERLLNGKLEGESNNGNPRRKA